MGERLVSHAFACTARGYRGWVWSVTLARAPRARVATVCEVDLLAGDGSLLPPEWLPWSERLRPGDVGAGDVLPRIDDDERLEAGFEATGDEDVDQVAIWELGLGRPRVLAREVRLQAGTRWDAGDFGPGPTTPKDAAEQCRSCGFLLPMAGVLRQGFGICTNEWSVADGRVVSLGVRLRRPQRDRPRARALASERALPRRERARRRSSTARREPGSAAARAPGGVGAPARRSRRVSRDPFGTAQVRERVLAAWSASPERFREDANSEEDLALGGYRDRVLVELAQNAADAAARAGVAGRLLLRLVEGPESVLVAANTGARLDAEGVRALATLRASAKRDGAATGRFGVGFSAVLALSDEPAVVSHGQGVRFSRAQTRADVRESTSPGLADELRRRDEHVPVLRLPYPAEGSAPPGYDTAVLLPLRDGGALELARRLLDRLDDSLLVALPGLAEVVVERPGEATRVLADVHERWHLLRRNGSHDAAGAGRPSHRGAGASGVVAGVGRPPATGRPAVPPTVHAPTPTDEVLGWPALLVADLPLDPDRRHVVPGAAAEAVLVAAAEAYAELLEELARDGAVLDLVPTGLPGRLGRRPPARGRARRAACRAGAAGRRPRGGAAASARRRRPHRAGRPRPGGRRRAGAGASTAWWPRVRVPSPCCGCSRCAAPRWPTSSSSGPTWAVPTSTRPCTGRCCRRPPTPPCARRWPRCPCRSPTVGWCAACAGSCCRPRASRRTCWRRSAGTACVRCTPSSRPTARRPTCSSASVRNRSRRRSCSTTRRCTSWSAPASTTPTRPMRSTPSWGWCRSRSRPVPSSRASTRSSATCRCPTTTATSRRRRCWCSRVPRPPTCSTPTPSAWSTTTCWTRWGADVLRAVGVADRPLLVRVGEVDPHDLPPALDDLDDADRWVRAVAGADAGAVVEGPVLAVRDLDLVDADRRGDLLAALASDPELRAALVREVVVRSARGARRAPSYTAWWLRRHAGLAGRRPAGTAGDAVVPQGPAWTADLPHDVAAAVGMVRTVAELDPAGRADLLRRMGGRGTAEVTTLLATWAALTADEPGDADEPDVDLGELTWALAADGSPVRCRADEPVVLDDARWWQRFDLAPRVVAAPGRAERLADLLDLDLASDRAAGEVTSTGTAAPLPPAVLARWPRLPSTWQEHDDLRVDDVEVDWWVESVPGQPTVLHAATGDGLARAVAHAAGDWASRHLVGQLLDDDAAAAALVEDALG